MSQLKLKKMISVICLDDDDTKNHHPLKMISNNCTNCFKSLHRKKVFSAKMLTSANIPRVKLVTVTCSRKRKFSSDHDDKSSPDDETDSNFLHRTLKYQKIEFSHEELSEKHLWLLTNAYDSLTDWRQLAAMLQLTKQDIDLIEFNYLKNLDGLKECFYQTLLTWRLQSPENCNFSFLSKVLRQMAKSLGFCQMLAESMFDQKCSAKKILANYNSDAKTVATGLLSEKQLWSVSEVIGSQWKSVGRSLDLAESSLSDVEARYARFEGARECCYQMLLLWSQCYADRCTLEYLCLSLIDMRFNLYARQIFKVFSLQ